MKLVLTLFTFLVWVEVCSPVRNTFPEQARELLSLATRKKAEWSLTQEPMTVTAAFSPRSSGTVHDFFSEGDYWWPDSTNLDGPYVQRDGLTNPENFTAHRKAMIRLSTIVASLASAWTLDHDERYLNHAMKHLNAWFVQSETKMNPHLLYAQAIKGRVTGRGIGIIDTIHLIEVAQSVRLFEKYARVDRTVISGVKEWFCQYLLWLTSHPYGLEEMNAKNNHGTCWVMQVAAFAKLTGNTTLIQACIERYKTVLLPDQMAADGSFPLEVKRTKPYGYSIFNLDAMTMICQILSDEKENLWKFETSDHKSIKLGIEFLHPYLMNKKSWPHASDVMYWNNWPVAQPCLLFGAIKFDQHEWFETWRHLDHEPVEEEVVRNLPIRHPLIWLSAIETASKKK
jgi:hypothetical protein